MKAIPKKANAIDCATQLDTAKLQSVMSAPSNDVDKLEYVIRYLGVHSWKGLTTAEVQAIQNAGLKIISVYETNPTHDSYFTVKRGLQDAMDAHKNAEAIGQPHGSAIYFTVDEGTRDFADVLTYFQALKNELKDYKLGAYGDYDVIEHLKKNDAVDYYFQTYAWSAGKLADAATVYQYHNAYHLGSVEVDLDFVSGDAGAWQAVEHHVTVHHKTDAAHVTNENTYTIQKGDTLWGLETKWDLTHGTLAHINPQIKNPDDIYEGEVIHVPAAVRIDKRQPHEKPHTYIVQSGDTLSKIAAKHHTTVAELMKLNPQIKNKNEIYAGDHIVLPAGHHHVAHEFHTIQHGETLSGIAKRYHTTVGHLLNLNPNITNKNKIYAGERVRVK